MTTPISLSRFRLGAAAAGLVFTAMACGGGTQLPDPIIENVVDSTIVYALNGTTIGTASAFDVVASSRARPELREAYDFAFDIDAGDRPLLLPGNLAGLPSSAGLLESEQTFDEIVRAPLEGYVSDTALVAEVGTVFIARSRSTTTFCSALVGALPRYGKFEVTGIDPAERTVTLRFMVNMNCGYRDLTPGLPEQ